MFHVTTMLQYQALRTTKKTHKISETNTNRNVSSDKLLSECEYNDYRARHDEDTRKRCELINALQRNYKCLSQHCYESACEIRTLKSSLEHEKKNIDALELKISEHQNVTEVLDTVKQQKENIEKTLNNSKESLDLMKQKYQKLEVKLSDSNAGNYALHSQLTAERKSLSHYKTEMLVVNTQLKERQTQASVKEKHCGDLELMLKKNKKTIKELKISLADLQIRHVQTTNVCHRAASDRDNLRDDVSRLTREHLRLQSRFHQCCVELKSSEDIKKGLVNDLRSMESRQSAHNDISHLVKKRLECSERNCVSALNNAESLAIRNKSLLNDEKLLQVNLKHQQQVEQELIEQNESLIRDKELWQNNLKSLDTIRDENIKLQQLIADTQIANQTTTKDINKSFANHDDNKTINQHVEDLNQRLNAAQTETKNIVDTLEHERDCLKKKFKECFSRNDLLENEAESIRVTMMRMKTDFERDSRQMQTEVESTLKSLRQQVKELKQRFSEQEQNEASNTIDSQSLVEHHKKIASNIELLVSHEESSKTYFQCLQCMKSLVKPVTCVPCGHSYCEHCLISKGFCTQCGSCVEITFYPNQILCELTQKHIQRKQTLATLQNLSNSE